MKIFITFLILLSFLNADISIKKAWEKVLHVNEGLKASKSDVKHATQLKESKKSMYLPQINIAGSYTRMEKELSIDTTIPPITIPGLGTLPAKNIHSELQDQDVFSANLSIFWPIYTGGKIDAANNIYAAKTRESEAKYRLEEDKAFLKLIKVYYGVVVSKSLLIAREEAQIGLQHHYENAKKLKNAGQVANIELLNAKVKLDSAKVETTKARYKYEITKLALKDMISSSDIPSSSVFFSNLIQSEQAFKDKMLSNYPGLSIIDEKQDQVNSLIDIEKAAYKPTFFAFGNYLLYKDNSPLMDMTPNWIAGIGFKFNLLSREGKSEKIAAAKILKNKLIHTKLQAQSDLLLLVEKTYKEMLQYRQEYKDLDSTLELATENLRLREIAFKEGLATSVEVVDAQTFLTAAKTKRLNALYNFVQKISQLSVLSGDRNIFFELEKNSIGITNE